MTNLYISELGFAYEAAVLEDAQDVTNQVIEFAENLGLKLIEGNTNRSREREAVESVSYASAEPYRNLTAREADSFIG